MRTDNALQDNLLVRSCLKQFTGFGGGFRKIDSSADGNHDCEPHNRQRLDHFGNGGDGWDSEGWSSEYERPLVEALEKHLAKAMPNRKFSIDVDEKGFVGVTLLP